MRASIASALKRASSQRTRRPSSSRSRARERVTRCAALDETKDSFAPETEESEDVSFDDDALIDESEDTGVRSLPFVNPSAFVDAASLEKALGALRRATSALEANAAAAWLDRAAGDTKRRAAAAREAAMAFVEARKEWSEVPVEVVRRAQSALASTAASRGDIGWLAAEAAETAVDGGDAFDARLRDVVNGKRLLSDDYAYLLVPGLFGSYYPAYYTDVRDVFRDRGVDCRISRLVDGEGRVESNAAALAREIKDVYDETGKRVIVIGHSKGGVDAGAALALHKLEDFVRGLICMQSPFGGSPIATDLLCEPLIESFTTVLETFVSAPKGTGAKLIEPIRDLTYAERRLFLAKHPIPKVFPVVTFATATKSAAAGLFPSASYVLSRYGELSDGLVCVRDTQIPNAVFVTADFENDHADCVFPIEHPDDMIERHAREQAENLALRQALGFSDPARVGPTLPPPVGPAIVRAQRALNSALPERLKNSFASADYHEALVGVLLTHPHLSLD